MCYFFVRFLFILFSVAVQSSLRPLHHLAAGKSQLTIGYTFTVFLIETNYSTWCGAASSRDSTTEKKLREVNLRRPRRWGYDWIEIHPSMFSRALQTKALPVLGDW